MPYTINKSDGTFLVVVNDGATDKSATSLSLPARNVLTYGRDVAENFVYLVENFANTTAPTSPLNGQLWFDTAANVLREYTAGSWIQVGLNAFNTTADTLAGNTIAGNASTTNRIGGTTGYPLSYGGGSTSISILTGEGKVIGVLSPEAIPAASLPATIVLQYRSFDFKSRFPNGLVAGMTLATDAANYIYGGSNQFTNILSEVPYLLGGDDSSTTANHVSVAVSAPLTGYTKYLGVEAKVANTNTGPAAININGLGEVPIVRRSAVPLSAGDLLAGYYYKFLFDGAQFRVDDAQANGYVGPTGPQGIQGPAGAASTVPGPTGPQGPSGPTGTPSVYVASDANQSMRNALPSGQTPTTTITLNTSPTFPSTVPDNNIVVFSPTMINVGATTINGIPLLRGGGAQLQAGDLQPGTRVVAVSDGAGNLIHSGLCYGEVPRVTPNAVVNVDSTNGNDISGVGSVASPFKTLSFATSFAANNLAFPGGITFKLLTPGTYDIPEYFPSFGQPVNIVGDNGNQNNYIITRTTATTALVLSSTPSLTFYGVNFINPGINNAGTIIATGGTVNFFNCSFGVATGRTMGSGSVFQANPYSIIGLADGCVFSGDAPQGSWAFANGGLFGTGNLSATPVRTVTFLNNPKYAYTVSVAPLSIASFLPGLQFVGQVTANQWGIGKLGYLATSNRTGSFIPGQTTYNFNNGLLT